MSASGAYSSMREASAALEDWIESSGEFDSLLSDDDASETPSDDENPPEDEENPAAEESEEDAEGDEGDEEASDEEGEDAEGEEDAGGIDSIESLASEFEVEPDEVLSNLMVEDADGERVPLGQALEAWRDSDVRVAERQRELEQEHAQLIEQTNEKQDKQLAQLVNLNKTMIGMLQQGFSQARMEQLRQENPDAYIQALEQKQQIDAAIQNSIQAMEQIGQARQGQSAEDVTKVLQEENRKLLRAKPEWRDQKVRSRAMAQGQQLLRDLGWSQNEIDQVTDHRILLLVDKAVKGHRFEKGTGSRKVQELKKKGLRRPSTGLRSSSRREPVNPRTKARREGMARLKKSGRPEDAAALFMDHIED